MKTYLRNLLRAASIVLILCNYNAAFAQLPIYDGINYTPAESLSAQSGWAEVNTNTDDVLVAAGSLSYPGITSVGNKAAFAGAGSEAMRSFTAVSSGTVYYSFLLNVTSLGSLNTAGGYFSGFASGTTNFGGAIWTRRDDVGYDIGLSARSNSTPSWTNGTMAVNTTVFVVVSYQIISGTANDIVKIWINPGVATSEGAADITITNAGSDLSAIDRIFLRQDGNSATPNIEMDEFRIGTTWNDVNPAPAGTLTVLPTTLPDFGTITVGSNSASDSFEVTGASLGNQDIVIAAPDNNFQVSTDNVEWYPSVMITPVGGAASETIFVRFAPQSAGTKSGNVSISSTLAATQTVAVWGTGEAFSAAESDIVVSSGFTYASNIDYTLFQGTDATMSNSVALAGFTIRDGGADAADWDALPTELTALSFNVTNPGSLLRIALYQGTTELAEVDAAATISFDVPVTVDDDGTQELTIRATFKAAVTDNQQVSFLVNSATAALTGSTFAAENAGGAASSTSDDINRIEVIATQLVFANNASSGAINAAMSPAPEVRAVDNNNNRDLDYVTAMELSSTGTLSGSPVSVVPVNGQVVFSGLTHTAPGSGLQLAVSSGALTPATSLLFNIFSPIFSNTITGTNPNASNPYTAGQVVSPGIIATGVGRGSGITGTNANNRYNANSWNTTSIDEAAYFEFTIEPVAGYKISFVNFAYTGQASGSGPVSFAFRSNANGDNFTTNIGLPLAGGASISLDAVQFQDVTGPITFRLYGWGASSSSGTFSIDDFTFNGEVSENTTAVITASEIAGILSYSHDNGPSAGYQSAINAAFLDPAEGSLLVSAPLNFEVSTDNVNFSDSVLIPYASGTLSGFPFYVRLQAGLSAGTYSGDVVISGGNASEASVAIEGSVTVPMQLSYINSLRTLAEYNSAISSGFTFADAPHNSTYVRIYPQGYIETPFIDFTNYSTLQVTFQAATFGGSSGQTLSLQISTDGGSSYSSLGSYSPNNGSTYIDYSAMIDLTAYQSTNGKIRIMMTSGTNETRFRDLQLLSITTWNGESWSAGEPDLDTAAIIAGDYSESDILEAYTLTVQSGSVTFEPGATLHLLNQMTNAGGSVTFENNANLIQTNSGSNSGIISISREAQLKRLDYVYWSAPVSGQLLQPFSSETLPNRFYRLDEPTNAFAAVDPLTEFFGAGRGYMIRAPNTFTTTPQTFTGVFTGTPRNGNVSVPVTSQGAGYNLVGNPYPSPVSATSFLAQNPSIGTLYFWTHTNQQGGGVNYASFNGTGSVAAAGGETPNGIIQTGQGFLVNVQPATTNVVFNNSMRVDDHQNQFFRTQNEEKHRLWLRLSSESGSVNQMLVGYVNGASNDIDTAFDGKLHGEAQAALFSILGDGAFVIQGRSLPFSQTDQVSLGFRTASSGQFTITLDDFDGVFAEGQDVYILDNLTGLTHDIKQSPYTFSSIAGNFGQRFMLQFQNTTLGIGDEEASSAVIAYSKNGLLHISSSNSSIETVQIYDLSGRLLFYKRGIDVSDITLNELSASSQLLLLKVTTGKNTVSVRKVLH